MDIRNSLKNVILSLFFFPMVSCAYVGKDAYLEKVRANKNMTYAQVIKRLHIINRHPKELGMVESEFISWNVGSKLIAIDFEHTQVNQIIKLTPNYGVGFYDFGLDKYGVLFDKDGNVKDIVLLAYRKGNSEWQVERVVDRNTSHGVFLVDDQYRGTEWITRSKGVMLIMDESVFVIDVARDYQTFQIEKTSYMELYRQEDRRLKHFYKLSMSYLTKDDRKDLRNIQRSWLGYTMKKCNRLLEQTASQPEESVHFQSYKGHCLYEETRRRAKELESLTGYLEFYR